MEMNKDLETRQAAQGQSFSQPANTLLQYGPKSKEHFFKNLHTLRTIQQNLRNFERQKQKNSNMEERRKNFFSRQCIKSTCIAFQKRD